VYGRADPGRGGAAGGAAGDHTLACTKVLEKLALAGDPDGYPGKDEVAEYLEANARHFDLPVLLGTGIQVLARHNGGFRATTDDGARIEARAVVLATGAFQTPAISRLAAGLAADVRQFTAETYRNAARLPPGTTLVVGDGATGRDICARCPGHGQPHRHPRHRTSAAAACRAHPRQEYLVVTG
jgi:cation diffusion facilitator CzcD-associated flavoprotein CzcO